MTALKNVDELDAWLKERHLNGHWRGMGDRVDFQPYLWKWADIYEGLMAATELVPMEDTGRRTIQLRNPSMGDRMSNSIHISVQCVLPGEVAEAHRHSAAAIRFIIKGGEKAFTIVNGEPLPMNTGDFITTPNWSWHDHVNDGPEPVMWLDGLDIRLVNVGKMLGEGFPERQQPRDKPIGWGLKTMGHAKPSWVKSEDEQQPPPFRYPWEETLQTLNALKETESEGDPYDGLKLTYTNPVNGGATLPTFACELLLLTPNMKTKDHKHVSTTIYQAFRGSGVTIVDGQRLEWSQGDIFVVPPWSTHHHENKLSEDSMLFAMDDYPALKSLGLYREEAMSS